MTTSFEKRQRRAHASESLPDDMDHIKAELARLRDHTGLPEADPEVDVDKSSDA